MPRCRDNSFCCGAGGGRIWMPDPVGKERPSENRMHEAASLGNLDAFVVCCPKDMTMFEDARKTSGHEGDFVVQDLAELVAEAIDLKSIDLKEVPALVDRIAEAAAVRIADAVTDRLADRLADAVTERVLGELADRAPTVAATASQQPAPAVEAAEPVVGQAEPATAAGPWRPTPVSAATLPPLRRAGEERTARACRGQTSGRAERGFCHRRGRAHNCRRAFRARTERVGRGSTGGSTAADRTARRGRGCRRHRRPGRCRGHPAPRARQGRPPGGQGVGRDTCATPTR